MVIKRGAVVRISQPDPRYPSSYELHGRLAIVIHGYRGRRADSDSTLLYVRYADGECDEITLPASWLTVVGQTRQVPRCVFHVPTGGFSQTLDEVARAGGILADGFILEARMRPPSARARWRIASAARYSIDADGDPVVETAPAKDEEIAPVTQRPHRAATSQGRKFVDEKRRLERQLARTTEPTKRRALELRLVKLDRLLEASTKGPTPPATRGRYR